MDDLRPLMDCWQEGQGSFIERRRVPVVPIRWQPSKPKLEEKLRASSIELLRRLSWVKNFVELKIRKQSLKRRINCSINFYRQAASVGPRASESRDPGWCRRLMLGGPTGRGLGRSVCWYLWFVLVRQTAATAGLSPFLFFQLGPNTLHLPSRQGNQACFAAAGEDRH